jgi:glycosyltransferase involved in cell wall biosynthesis
MAIKISALIHTYNNERTLGRTLESLHAVDEIVVVDHQSTDKTVKVAKQYGSRVIKAVAGVDRGAYTVDCKYDWILCVLPNETMSEALEASIFEWKRGGPFDGNGFLVNLRKQSGDDWQPLGPQMRIADRNKINWQDLFPSPTGKVHELGGDLLRFGD